MNDDLHIICSILHVDIFWDLEVYTPWLHRNARHRAVSCCAQHLYFTLHTVGLDGETYINLNHYYA
jgi:hypothetical protein